MIESELYCASSHPASKLTSIIDDNKLTQFTHIAISDSARQLVSRSIDFIGLKQFLYVANMEQKYQALINAMGITHLPHYIASPALKKGLIKKIPTTHSNKQHINLAWQKNNTGKANLWLRKKIIEEAIFSASLNG